MHSEEHFLLPRIRRELQKLQEKSLYTRGDADLIPINLNNYTVNNGEYELSFDPTTGGRKFYIFNSY